MSGITKRWVTTAAVPSSPDMAQNVCRVQGEIHDIPVYGNEQSETPLEPYRHFIPMNSIVCTWTEDKDPMDTHSMIVSSKTQREGRIANVFSNFADVNLTGANEKTADKYNVRFWGISQDGVQDGELALQEPVAAGRLTVACSGLLPVNNHMTFMKDAEYGDFIQLIKCDSGGRWEDDDPRYGTPILRAVSPQRVYALMQSGSDHTHSKYNVSTSASKLSSAAIRNVISRSSTYSGSAEADTNSLAQASMVSVPYKEPGHSLIVRASSAIPMQTEKLIYLGASGTDARFGLSLFGINSDKIDQTVPLVYGQGLINPFARLPVNGVKSSLADAFLFGTGTTPSFVSSLYDVLNLNYNGPWLIDENSPLCLRFTASSLLLSESIQTNLVSSDETARIDAKANALAEMSKLLKQTADVVLSREESKILRENFEMDNGVINQIGMNHSDLAYVYEFPLQSEKEQSLDLFIEWHKVATAQSTDTVGISIGASAALIENPLSRFCQICNNVDASGHYMASAEDTAKNFFNSKWDQLNAEDKKVIISNLLEPVEGYSAHYIMSEIRDVFGKCPLFFDHPFVRHAMFDIQPLTANVEVAGNLYPAKHFLSANMSETLLHTVWPDMNTGVVPTSSAAGPPSAAAPSSASLFGGWFGTTSSEINSDSAHVLSTYGIPTSSHLSMQTDDATGSFIELATGIEDVQEQVDAYPVKLKDIIGVFRGSTPGQDQFTIDLNIRPITIP